MFGSGPSPSCFMGRHLLFLGRHLVFLFIAISVSGVIILTLAVAILSLGRHHLFFFCSRHLGFWRHNIVIARRHFDFGPSPSWFQSSPSCYWSSPFLIWAVTILALAIISNLFGHPGNL